MTFEERWLVMEMMLRDVESGERGDVSDFLVLSELRAEAREAVATNK
jgi:hypothetical protein